MIDILFQGIFSLLFDLICYPIGCLILALCFPHIQLPPLKRQKGQKAWKWTGVIYEQDGQKYFYFSTIYIVGIFGIILLIAIIGVTFSFLR